MNCRAVCKCSGESKHLIKENADERFLKMQNVINLFLDVLDSDDD